MSFQSGTYHGNATMIISLPNQGWFYAQDLPATSTLTLEVNTTSATYIGIAAVVLVPYAQGGIVTYDASGPIIEASPPVSDYVVTNHEPDWVGMGYSTGASSASVGAGESLISDCIEGGGGVDMGIVDRGSPVGFVGNVSMSVNESGGAEALDVSGFYEILPPPTVSVAPGGPLLYDWGQLPATLTATANYSGSYSDPVWWYNSTSPNCGSSSRNMSLAGLSFTPSTFSNGTLYYCAVISDGGVPGYTNSSLAVRVSVNGTLDVGYITPRTNYIDVGQSVALHAGPSGGTAPYTIKWYSATSPSGTCSSGTYVGTSSVDVASPATNTSYCYVVSDSSQGSPKPNPASSWAPVKVRASLVAGAIAPWYPSLDPGQDVELTSNPSGGNGSYGVRWYSSSTNIGSCTSGTLLGGSSTLIASPSMTTYYCYDLTDSSIGFPAANVNSSWDLVGVSADLYAGSVFAYPSTIDIGQTTNLSDTGTVGGVSPYTFQWRSGNSSTCTNDSPISGGTASGLMAEPASSAYFCVQVRDASTGSPSATAFSDAVLVRVNVDLEAGPITPSSSSIDDGQSILLTETTPTGGTAPYTYQWRSGAATDCPSDTIVSGATLPVYSPSPSTDTYYCVQIGDSSQGAPSLVAYSMAVLITVTGALSVAAVTPTSPSVDSGQSIVLDSHVEGGTPPFGVQWYSSSDAVGSCDDGSWIDGATSTSYLAPHLTSSSYFCYVVIDSSAGGDETLASGWDLVTVNPVLSAGAITLQSGSGSAESAITLQANPSGGTPLFSYQWFSSPTGNGDCDSGTPLGGATREDYSPTATSTEFYCYQVTDSSAAGSENASSIWGNVTLSQSVPAGGSTQNLSEVSLLIAVLLVALVSFTAWKSGWRPSRPRNRPTPPQTLRAPAPMPPVLGGITWSQPSSSWPSNPALAFGSYPIQPPPPPNWSGGKDGVAPSVLGFSRYEAPVTGTPKPAEGNGAPSAPKLDATKVWTMTITARGIEVAGAPPQIQQPVVIDADFVPVGADQSESNAKLEDPVLTPEHAYSILRALDRKPRTMLGLQEAVPLMRDEWALALVSAMVQAKLVVSGSREKDGDTVFALTPVGREFARGRGRSVGATPEGLPPPSGSSPESEVRPDVIGEVESSGAVMQGDVNSSPVGAADDSESRSELKSSSKTQSESRFGARFFSLHPKEDLVNPSKSSETNYPPSRPKPPAQPPLTLGEGVRVQDAHRIGEERGSVDEESPFDGLKPEDVNPQLKGTKPLSKSVLQPMEMRVTQDRGSEVRESSESLDSQRSADELVEAAKRARQAKKSKIGVQQKKRPPQGE